MRLKKPGCLSRFFYENISNIVTHYQCELCLRFEMYIAAVPQKPVWFPYDTLSPKASYQTKCLNQPIVDSIHFSSRLKSLDDSVQFTVGNPLEGVFKGSE